MSGPTSRDVETVLDARYWLTAKGWAAVVAAEEAEGEES